jgi:hypothetical protein
MAYACLRTTSVKMLLWLRNRSRICRADVPAFVRCTRRTCDASNNRARTINTKSREDPSPPSITFVFKTHEDSQMTVVEIGQYMGRVARVISNDYIDDHRLLELTPLPIRSRRRQCCNSSIRGPQMIEFRCILA